MLHPWLRVVRNGDRIVNATRADGSTKMACASVAADPVETAPVYAELTRQAAGMPRQFSVMADAAPKKLGKRRKLADSPPATNAFVNVFIEFFPERVGHDGSADARMTRVRQRILAIQKTSGAGVPAAVVQRRNMLCATVPVSMLDELDRDPAIAFVHPSDPLKLEPPTVRRAPTVRKLPSKAIGSAARFGRGEGVLIGIIDVGGFDFSHPDFLDDTGRTRFVSIWDQGGDFRPSPQGFAYGSELTQAAMNDAIDAAATPGLPPAPWIERQSQLRPGSHGTHVASIAAGNSGVCPRARIAAVLIDVPAPASEVERRRATFSDTSRISHAVEYLIGVAEREGLPLSINLSLGTNGGSHDGSSGVARWLDACLSAPGRAVCVAAGNAGQEKSLSEGDLGWIMGRIHTSGQIPARGLEVDIDWVVVGDGIEDWSENELEIWYASQDRFSVSMKPPGASEWITVRPGEYVENRRLPDGVTVSAYNELYHPANGGNYVSVYLSPNLDPAAFRGITPGVWKVRLRGEEVRDGRFDAWIERDDPSEVGRDGARRMFRFPSFFSERSNVDSHSLSSLACGQAVIAVANLDEAALQINATSSQGPTRDGRCKPEIAAPGTHVLAANGFAERDEPWIAMSGTSMASPYVTGVVALMLAKNPELTAAQCLGILQRTARPLPGASYRWVNDVGFGRIDAEAALDEARSINTRTKLR